MAEPLERTVRIRCDVGHAFDVFTRCIDLWWPSGHRRFEGSHMHLDPSVGGRFEERSAKGEVAQLGEVIECDPPHRIRYTWLPGAIDRPTLVEVTFAALGDETEVRVHHSIGDSGLGDAWPKRVELFERGWRAVLTAFSASAQGDTL